MVIRVAAPAENTSKTNASRPAVPGQAVGEVGDPRRGGPARGKLPIIQVTRKIGGAVRNPRAQRRRAGGHASDGPSAYVKVAFRRGID